MATATKKSLASKKLAGAPAHVHVPAAMEFVIFEDNSGSFQWSLLGREGATLGQSGAFASYGDAEQAARQVRDGAASARLEPRVTGTGSVAAE